MKSYLFMNKETGELMTGSQAIHEFYGIEKHGALEFDDARAPYYKGGNKMTLEKKALICLIRGIIAGVVLGLLLYVATLPTPKGAGVWTAETWADNCAEYSEAISGR